MKKFLASINVIRQCRELDVPLKSCPRFLFVVMGFIIVVAILLTYAVGQRYATPDTVIGAATGLTIVLMVIMHVIVQAFEQVVIARRREAAHAKEVLLLRDQFVYVAIHNLRSGGTAIKWGLKLLEGNAAASPSGGETLNIVRQMRKKNEALLKLANNILLVTRIDSGALAVGSEEVSVREMVEGALLDESEVIDERKTRIVVDVAENIPMVLADPIYLRETLGLLVRNAVDHSDYSASLLRITAAQQGREVLIAVQNNGMAIPPNDQEHIFEQYWRAGGPGKSEGTGFPLYIAHELVRLMSGRIWFSSVPDSTNFTVALPIA